MDKEKCKYFCRCGCGGDNCWNRHCDGNCWRYNSPLHQQIVEENIYQRGFTDGLREHARQRIYFRTPAEQEAILEKLKTAMKPLEELRKELTPP